MISEEEYKQLTNLARLNPENKTLQNTRSDLTKILDYIQKVQEVNTSQFENDTLDTTKQSLLREDIAKDLELKPQTISKIAPQWEAGYFVVPGVIQTEN